MSPFTFLFCLCLGSIWLFPSPSRADWDRNIFHMLIHNITETLNVSDCWLCAHGPRSVRAGWPIMPAACLEPREWNRTHLFPVPSGDGHQKEPLDPDQFHLSNRQAWPLAPICVVWHNLPSYRTLTPTTTEIPFHQLGDYPNCNCTVPIANPSIPETASFHPSCLPQFILDNKRVNMSLNQVQATYSAILNVAILGLPQGLFWICGSWAGRVLPPAWNGTCTIGTLVPAGIQFFPKAQPTSTWGAYPFKRSKRALDESYGYDPDRTYLTEAQRLGAILFPAWGVALNVRQIRRLSYQLEALANTTADMATALQAEVVSITETLIQHKLGLDFLFSRVGGLCKWLNKIRCCHLIDMNGRIVTDIEKIHQVASDIQKTYTDKDSSLWGFLTDWLPDITWVKELFISIIGLVAVIVVSCVLIQCAIPLVARRYSLVR